MRQIEKLPLWLGHIGDAQNLERILSAGIQAIVDLAANEPPIVLTREVVYCRFPLVDGAGNPAWMIRTAVGTVASLMRSVIPTLMYCSAGMSRAPVIAAGAISKVQGCLLAEALTAVAAGGPADVSPSLLADVEAALA